MRRELRTIATALAIVALFAMLVLSASPADRALAATTHFSTLPPGTALPNDATCAGLVRPVAEQRADNAKANSTVPLPGSIQLARLGTQNGYNNRAQAFVDRVTGNHIGTTDEIIQWAACKWGFDEDVVRAIAITESNWHQSQAGDMTTQASLCPPGYSPTCARSFGIHQVTWNTDPMGTFPWARDSTAFNLDASLMIHRLCYEGSMTWLRNIGYTQYRAGDMWGCVGQWFSGNWHDAAAQGYITKVQGYQLSKPWTQPTFSNVVTGVIGAVCPCLRYGFDGGSTQGWSRGWGSLSVAVSSTLHQSGAGSLAIQLSPTAADWPAVQVSSPLGLASAMAVTYWVYQPSGTTVSSVQPYVADSNWNDLMVAPIKLVTGWNKVTWMVPATNGIKAIGLEVNDDSGWNGQLALDSVSW
jgi:hypothetical protein